MRLKNYLRKNESVVVDVPAYDNKTAVSKSQMGELAVIPNRVIFANDEGVTDISLYGINSIDYKAPKYPVSYLYWGFGLICLSILGYALSLGIEFIFIELIVIAFFSGIGVLIYGLFLRRSALKVHTSNKSYEFVSNDDQLIDVAHAVRGHEQR